MRENEKDNREVEGASRDWGREARRPGVGLLVGWDEREKEREEPT